LFCFRPDLIAFFWSELPALPLLRLPAFDDPEAAVAGDVAQIPTLAVDRCDDDGLAWVAFTVLP
jgi:hypothetical protein